MMELTLLEQIGVTILFSPLYTLEAYLIALLLRPILRLIGYILTGEEIIKGESPERLKGTGEHMEDKFLKWWWFAIGTIAIIKFVFF